MKYYCRSIREDKFGEVVVPEMKEPVHPDNIDLAGCARSELIEANEEWNEHLASLPLYALLEPPAKVGWVGEVEEDYQTLESYGQGSTWYSRPKDEYNKKDPERRRIVLVGKKPEQEITTEAVSNWMKSKKPEEKKEEVCSCGVPLSLHNTCCGWGNANLIVFQWEKTISFGPDDAKKRYEISQLPPEQQEAAFKQHFGNIISVPPNAAAPQSSHLRWVKYKDRKPTKDGYYVCKCYYEQSDVVAGALYMEFKEGGFWSEDEVYNLEWLEQTLSTDQEEGWKECACCGHSLPASYFNRKERCYLCEDTNPAFDPKEDEEKKAICDHCGDVIEPPPVCRNCDIQLTLPDEEY